MAEVSTNACAKELSFTRNSGGRDAKAQLLFDILSQRQREVAWTFQKLGNRTLACTTQIPELHYGVDPVSHV
jgi:hypothetical protein